MWEHFGFRKISLLLMLALLSGQARAATNDPTTLLQQGLFEEEANHNNAAAAQAYQGVIAQFDSNRVIAATAIFRLAETYRRQGKTGEAALLYERIINEFSDQEILTELSRKNAGAKASPSKSTEQAKLETRLKALRALAPTDRRILIQQQYPSTVLDSLLQELARTEQRLAELNKQYGPSHPEVVTTTAKLQSINKQIEEQVASTIRGLELQIDLLRTPRDALASSPGQDKFSSDGIPESSNEINRIKQLIRNSPDLINAPQANGETLLESAAGKGNLEIVKLLLENGAVINGIKSESLTPLHFAAANGHKAVVDYLLAHGADAKATTSDGLTPLHLAARKGYLAVASSLIEKGASLNAVCGRVYSRQLEDLSFGNESPGMTPLRFAADARYTPVVKLLISKGADVNIADKSNCTPLNAATYFGQEDIVKELLKAGANPNVPDQPALIVACVDKRTNIARLLVEAGADPNTNGYSLSPNGRSAALQSPLGAAIAGNSVELVQLLLQFKGDPNALSAGTPPVFLAATKPDILVILLEHGANPNVRKQGDCHTPLEAAAIQNNLKCVQLFLAHGADPNENEQPCWPLAVEGVDHCTPEVYEALLEKHLDTTATIGGGDTALHRAAFLGKQEHMRLLLEHGANPNVRNSGGKTPIMLAKQIDERRTVQVRLPKSETGTSSPYGTRPLRVVLVQMLSEHGARDDLPNFDRIEVRRPASNTSIIAFAQDTNDWNHFTLVEVIGKLYEIVSDDRKGVWPTSLWANGNLDQAKGPQYPDFEHMILHRASADGRGWSNFNVNASELVNSGQCAEDEPLQWGDVLELPEVDHTVAEPWKGLNGKQIEEISKCVARTVTVQQRGSNVTLVLKPVYRALFTDGGDRASTRVTRVAADFMLRSVLDQMKLVRFSSDLAHVKVTRPKDRDGKKHEWTFDCSNPDTAPAFWLRDGDIVEIPDKQSD
jgi:ankyrin repeat protein